MANWHKMQAERWKGVDATQARYYEDLAAHWERQAQIEENKAYASTIAAQSIADDRAATLQARINDLNSRTAERAAKLKEMANWHKMQAERWKGVDATQARYYEDLAAHWERQAQIEENKAIVVPHSSNLVRPQDALPPGGTPPPATAPPPQKPSAGPSAPSPSKGVSPPPGGTATTPGGMPSGHLLTSYVETFQRLGKDAARAEVARLKRDVVSGDPKAYAAMLDMAFEQAFPETTTPPQAAPAAEPAPAPAPPKAEPAPASAPALPSGAPREGFLGPQKTPEGKTTTVLLTGVSDPRINNARETNIPLLVPGQHGVARLLRGGKPTPSQLERAKLAAIARIGAGETIPSYDTVEEAEAAAKAESELRGTPSPPAPASAAPAPPQAAPAAEPPRRGPQLTGPGTLTFPPPEPTPEQLEEAQRKRDEEERRKSAEKRAQARELRDIESHALDKERFALSLKQFDLAREKFDQDLQKMQDDRIAREKDLEDRGFTRELHWHKEYNDNPMIKDYQQLALAWTKIDAIAKEPRRSVESDKGLIYAIIRLMDERTGVKDPEVRFFVSNSNLPYTIQSAAHWLGSTQVLPDDLYRGYIRLANGFMNRFSERYEKVADQYVRTAQTQKLNPANVVFDYRPTPYQKRPLVPSTSAPQTPEGRATPQGKTATKAMIDKTWSDARVKWPDITREEVIRQLTKKNWTIKDE
jgi:hypothetical protein